MKQVLNILALVMLIVFISISTVNAQKKTDTPDSSNKMTGSALDCIDCEIRKFQITSADAASGGVKSYKAVAGKEFDYRALNLVSLNIEWRLGTAPLWTINPVNPAMNWDINPFDRSSDGVGIIDDSVMPSTNSAFGSTNGLVSIIDVPTGSSICSITPFIDVFFEKDEMTNPDGTVPNWFYYWTEEYMEDLNMGGMIMFNTTTEAWDLAPTPLNMTLNYLSTPWPGSTTTYTYGKNRWGAQGGTMTVNSAGSGIFPPRLLVSGYDPAYTILDIALGCGYQKEILSGDPTTFVTGIDCFYTTWIHELEHVRIELENWSGGFDQNDDTDNDGYKDSWEVSNSTPMFPFMVGVDDKYDSSNPTGVGYMYEEDRCRNLELTVRGTADMNDWSFDDGSNPLGIYQGKQW